MIIITKKLKSCNKENDILSYIENFNKKMEKIMDKPKVGILMGSDSDINVMKEAVEIFKKFEVPYEISVLSAHRTPKEAIKYAETAEERGLEVIIAGAGAAAHLAGVIASSTVLPVIGVPVLSKSLSGMDSLFSMVQMPKGIPVAVVAIDGAANAAILATQILSIKYDRYREALKKYKIEMAEKVFEKSEAIKKQYS